MMDGPTTPVVPNITGDYYWKTCLEDLKESGITQVTIGKETKHDREEIS